MGPCRNLGPDFLRLKLYATARSQAVSAVRIKLLVFAGRPPYLGRGIRADSVRLRHVDRLMPTCPQCLSTRIVQRFESLRRCSETGYQGDGEYFQCMACGEVSTVDEMDRHMSEAA